MNLVDTSFQLFIKYGIRTINVNDIEKGFGQKLSSKINKASLVSQCVKKMENEFQALLEMPEEINEPAFQILSIYSGLMDYLLGINLAFFHDLKKYHRTCYDQLSQNFDNAFYETVGKTLKAGQQSGKITANLNVEMECLIHKVMLEKVVTELRFNTRTFDKSKVFNQLFEKRFTGINN